MVRTRSVCGVSTGIRLGRIASGTGWLRFVVGKLEVAETPQLQHSEGSRGSAQWSLS